MHIYNAFCINITNVQPRLLLFCLSDGSGGGDIAESMSPQGGGGVARSDRLLTFD